MPPIQQRQRTADRTPEFAASNHPGTRDSHDLVLPATVSAAIYVAFAIFYSIEGAGKDALIYEAFLFATLPWLSYCYFQGYARLQQAPGHSFRQIVVFAAVLAILQLFVPAFDSSDLYAYVTRGWEQYHYHLNPYGTMPYQALMAQYDPMLNWEWVANPEPYGFLFALLSRTICGLVNGNLRFAIFIFKLVNAIAYGAIAWLIMAVGRRLNGGSDNVPAYLFLWNPFILLESLANGHNDILMALFLMIALYAASSDFWILALPALAAAALIKYLALISVPFFFLFIVRRRGTTAAVLSSAIAMLLVFAASVPYLDHRSSLNLGSMGANLVAPHRSLAVAALTSYKILGHLIPPIARTFSTARVLIIATPWLVVSFLSLIQLVKFAANPEPRIEDLVVGSLSVLFMVVCIASSKFYSHYIGMFFPLAMVLRSEHWLSRLVVLTSVFQLFSMTFIGSANILNYAATVAVPIFLVLRSDRSAIRAALGVSWLATSIQEN